MQNYITDFWAFFNEYQFHSPIFDFLLDEVNIYINVFYLLFMKLKVKVTNFLFKNVQ